MQSRVIRRLRFSSETAEAFAVARPSSIAGRGKPHESQESFLESRGAKEDQAAGACKPAQGVLCSSRRPGPKPSAWRRARALRIRTLFAFLGHTVTPD